MPELRDGGASESSSIEGLAGETSSQGWEATEEPLELDPIEGEIRPEEVAVPRRLAADRPNDDIEPLEITDPESLRNSGAEDGGPGASPESGDEADARGWWQDHADRWTDPAHQREVELTPHERRPAPFRQEIAERIPDWGTTGEKTSGTVDMEGDVIDLVSGYAGPTRDLPSPRPGMHRITMAHVEAHAAAAMRIRGVSDATLYINRIPCPSQGRYRGCDESLPAMLPLGGNLTLYGPEGFCKVYRGLEDKRP